MPNVTPRIQVTCLHGERCQLYVEPWGTEFTVRRGEALFIESTALVTGDVEVSYAPGGISIAITADVEVSITDRKGRRYDL